LGHRPSRSSQGRAGLVRCPRAGERQRPPIQSSPFPGARRPSSRLQLRGVARSLVVLIERVRTWPRTPCRLCPRAPARPSAAEQSTSVIMGERGVPDRRDPRVTLVQRGTRVVASGLTLPTSDLREPRVGAGAQRVAASEAAALPALEGPESRARRWKLVPRSPSRPQPEPRRAAGRLEAGG